MHNIPYVIRNIPFLFWVVYFSSFFFFPLLNIFSPFRGNVLAFTEDHNFYIDCFYHSNVTSGKLNNSTEKVRSGAHYVSAAWL